jgi:hypothetical protein
MNPNEIMGLEWVVTGIILLGGMTACGISLFLKRRREYQVLSKSSLDLAKLEPDDIT